MEPASADARLVKRAYWLVRLRWIAPVAVAVGTYICGNLLDIAVQQRALYVVAGLLGVYNLVILLLQKHCSRGGGEGGYAAVRRIVNFQISADLFILTVLLHYSGGIENPFAFFFIFHMIVASILLSVCDSYLHATYAVLLFGLMILLEHIEVIDHYCLEGFVSGCSAGEKLYVGGTFFVFTITIYVTVYMATYISVRLKQAEQGYREANNMLREKDRIKDEYVLRVTHDIKSHLAAIQSCLAVVVNRTVGSIDNEASDFVNTAYRRTKKLVAFIKALLRLTQMRLSGELIMTGFSLRDTAQNAVASVEGKAREKSITLKCDIEASVDQIVGNELSIEEMLTNMLMNAIKYTPEKGEVALSVEDRGDFVQAEISDTGIGIPEAELGRVFDEFFRASNARKVEKDGTGLGLSIAKHIVERHGGQIEVHSIEGSGTKFRIRLPKGGNEKFRAAQAGTS